MKKLLIITLLFNYLQINAIVTKTITVNVAGTLKSYFTNSELYRTTNLTVNGTINAVDFRIMRDSMPNLSVLDLTNVTIDYYKGKFGTKFGGKDEEYFWDELPEYSMNRILLSEVYLPFSLTRIQNPYFNLYYLKKLIVRKNVTSIYGCMFSVYNPAIKFDFTLYMEPIIPPVCFDLYNSTNQTFTSGCTGEGIRATLCAFYGSLSTYRSGNPWNRFESTSTLFLSLPTEIKNTSSIDFVNNNGIVTFINEGNVKFINLFGKIQINKPVKSGEQLIINNHGILIVNDKKFKI